MSQIFEEKSFETSVVEVAAVAKSYGSLQALIGINFHIKAGEFVALLGLNGAGKTTLFQLLTGLFSADLGSINIAGSDIRKDTIKALARIGVVFQQPTLDMDLSVNANLRFHARLHGLHAREAKVRISEELQRLCIEDRINDPVHKLSGGNRRKVELARALLHDPDILLMDEATVGLDPVSRHTLLKYMHTLCESRKMAVLWATHLVDEADHADRVLILHAGKLVAEGAPAELIQQSGARHLADAFIKITGSQEN